MQIVINVKSRANAIFLTYNAYDLSALILKDSIPLLLLVACCTFLLRNSSAVAIVIALVEKQSIRPN